MSSFFGFNSHNSLKFFQEVSRPKAMIKMLFENATNWTLSPRFWDQMDMFLFPGPADFSALANAWKDFVKVRFQRFSLGLDTSGIWT